GTEVKPVATISFTSRIEGLEVSDDGKSLYVLITSGSTKKPTLVLVDTTTRKEVKRTTTKDLDEPARNMVKSGDGKNLIIVEGDLRTGKAAIVLFDPVKWTKEQTIPYSKTVITDVAPSNDGSMLVSLLAP